MTIELRILTGSGGSAGAWTRFEKPVVTIGRHPSSDLHFDPDVELDVSARHAELRSSDLGWSVYDLRSTNGTFVNGDRVAEHRRVFTGDVISFGPKGPRVEVRGADAPRALTPASTAAIPRDTHVRIAQAVEAETASLKRLFAMAFGAVVVIGGVAFAMWHRRTSAREHELLSLIARSESVSVPLMQTIASMQARDSQFARLLAQRDSTLAGEMATGRRMMSNGKGASPEAVALLSERVALETRLRQALTQMDFPRVHDLNDPAVAMVVSDLEGVYVAGTAFAVAPNGLLVTNRHILRAKDGKPPTRISVLFANTTEWKEARLIRESDDSDLSLIQVEGAAAVPVVAGVSRAGRDTRVGSPVASIGYPHAVDTPMEGTGLDVRARTTTTAGTVSKRIADVLQIDSYAGKGSSGSPVFDVHGNVVGVIYGGEAESNGRIVYAVPAEKLSAFLAASGVNAILR
ncbi:MAG TPA: trypsin-like peptidase domain-containing protein [Gemmatimonadaceae bacterium]